MAYDFYISIEGSTQGKFEGELPDPEHKGKMGGLAFKYGVMIPYDPATGHTSGKRQHRPLSIVKEWGAASPQMLTALVTKELLFVHLEFVRAKPDGAEDVFLEIKLGNASIIEVAQDIPSSPSHDARLDSREEWLFTFEKIVMVNFEPGTRFEDNWQVPVESRSGAVV